MKFNFRDILNFVKFPISISVSISSILGYILATNSVNFELLILWFAIFLLASGSSGLNQVQEWQFDGNMQRTRNRPIPRKVFSVGFGLFLSLSFIFLGLTFLFVIKGISFPLFLGIGAIIIYNLIYTPLKRSTPFAALPGAFIGAIPPMIGWTFAGGEFLHPLNISIAIFFFIWQIPHFWLLLIVYETDYRNAGFPVLTDLLNPLQIARLSFVWIVSLVVVALLIIGLLDKFSIPSFITVFLLGCFLLARIHRMVKVVQPQKFYKLAFLNLNMFVLFYTLILSFQKILNF
ncbi:MAG: protoheme IX farnesyltransferase [Ignavibacteria bacterium]|nr:protoheme IX farnesyltransferase [Ignavibacteria bacterium]